MPFLSARAYAAGVQDMASWRLALTESRRWIAERRGGKLLGPDQLLFALEPLQDEDFDFSGAVGAELNRPHDRGHFCGGDSLSFWASAR